MVKSQTPLPEHPRPDFNRPTWKNLNGSWDFKFDSDNRGLKEGWFKGTKFDKKIIVPFPWGSKLSKVKDEANIGWYYREINIPMENGLFSSQLIIVDGRFPGKFLFALAKSTEPIANASA